MAGTYALIVAAGRGTRAGGDVPKQYVRLAGSFVLSRTLRAFLQHHQVDGTLVVIHGDDGELYARATEGLAGHLLPPVDGGATRQQSVCNGLDALAELKPDHVLIHDAARPFVDAALISRVVDGLAAHHCVLPVTAMTDTIKEVRDGVVTATLDRSRLWGAQTPQGFHYAIITDLHRKAADATGVEFTDDASIAEWAGQPVHVVDGAVENRKLTTKADMEMAELQLRADDSAASETRTGFGFDVHGFEPGDGVWLCGVKVPFDRKLKGHSDADVAMHALTDAILGAIGAADIGHHFPPSDPQWKGAASKRFLEHAAALVAERGGRLVNVDVTIVCERPKVGPHREAMRATLAAILGIDVVRVSVKATTTEGLGFTGRQEGIAAQAVANVAIRSGGAAES
jgi:2-C-methyl-D-erythritol 4-phosphate cytidylyltransferase/2-C-methyl-D-erythritol 2,4-cyclodiphosphate synthase